MAIAEIVRWLQAHAGDATTAQDATALAGADADDRHRAGAHAAAATAQLEAATGTVLALSAAGARTWMRLQVDGVAVRERIVRIGDLREREPPMLAGVLGERDVAPATGAGRPARRGIVLLSAGRERRVGPHRLWVPWARRRAAQGDVVLRLDVRRHRRQPAPRAPDRHRPPRPLRRALHRGHRPRRGLAAPRARRRRLHA